MSTISLTASIEGLQEFVRKVGIATGNGVLRRPINDAMNRIIARLKTYPPPLPNQKYKRTGNLGRSWQSRVVSSGSNQFSSTMRGEVRNSIGYASFVQGSQQAAIHQGRWVTADKAIADEDLGEEIIKTIASALR